MSSSVKMPKKPIVLIVAAALPNYGIGFQGTMPWKLRKEMKYFRTVTTSTSSPDKTNAVVMGRKTWESIPEKFRPLNNRVNVVLSRSFENSSTSTSGVMKFNSLENAIESLASMDKIERIFIMGGADIYNLSLEKSIISHLLITEIILKNPDLSFDTFLAFDQFKNFYEKQPKVKLKEFVGAKVELPVEKISEEDFEYEFTMWSKI